MTGIKVPHFFGPSPKDYACAAIKTIGIQNYTYGTFSHALQVSIIGRCSFIHCITTDVFVDKTSCEACSVGNISIPRKN